MSYGYHSVRVEKQDPDTEEWAFYMKATARKINRAGGGEGFGAGAGQFHRRLTFVFPYLSAWRPVLAAPQIHRIVYNGQTFNIVDVDDFMERHQDLTVVGAAYG